MKTLRALLAALAIATLSALPALAQRYPLTIDPSTGKLQQLPANTELLLRPSASGNASLRIPHGSAPSSPVNGQIWTTTAGVFAYINGTTVGPFVSSGTGAGGSNTQVQYNSSGALAGAAGFAFDGTSVLSLGVPGASIGGVKLGNATSGTVTVQPVTGALGTVTASLPANTGTIAELNLGQTWTADQTYSSAEVITAASASGKAGLRLPHGTAPSSPVNGDCWTTTAGLFCQINGSTIGPYNVGSGSGSVVTTGSPASSNLAKFSGSASITNGDLTGDVTTSGALATTIASAAVTGSKIASSVALAGSPTTTTQSAKDNSTKIATTAYVDAATGLTSGTSVTLSAPRQYFICTSTCTITVPVPAAGYEFCVRNGDNVSTVITFAAIGSSAFYEKTSYAAYGTAGTGTAVSGGAVGDKLCLIGLDSTHYLVASYLGTWTMN